MFESDKPSKLNNIWWLLSIAAGLGVGHNLPPTYDVISASLVFFIASPFLLVDAILKGRIYDLRQARLDVDEFVGAKPVEPVEKQYTNLAPSNEFMLASEVVNIDPKMEKRFAQVLLVMRDMKPNDEAVDLREEFWIQKDKRDKFQNRNEFKAVRDKWEAALIVAKKAARQNSSYCVVNWDSVRRIAQGEKLL